MPGLNGPAVWQANILYIHTKRLLWILRYTISHKYFTRWPSLQYIPSESKQHSAGELKDGKLILHFFIFSPYFSYLFCLSSTYSLLICFDFLFFPFLYLFLFYLRIFLFLIFICLSFLLIFHYFF